MATFPINLIDLSKEVQKSNMGSIKQNFYFAPLWYFTSNGIKVPTGTDLSTNTVIQDTHEFIDGHGFHKVYNTLDKAGVTFEIQGERDGRSFKQKAKAFVPGSRIELHGMMAIMINEPCIVLLEESDGQVIQIGSKDYYAELIGKFMTGDTTAGLRGYEIEIESVAPVNYHYTGDLILYNAEVGS